MAKAPDAFRTISEVAELLDTPAHVLRFWESKFAQVKPVKRAGGRRYYRPDDVALLGGIKTLLHDQGMTIKGAQKVLRDRGVRAVTEMGRPPEGDVIDAVTLAPAPAPHPADMDVGVGTGGRPEADAPSPDADDDPAAAAIARDDRSFADDAPDVDAVTPAKDQTTEDDGPQPDAKGAPVAAPPRRLAITDISFVKEPTPPADNVVPMPRQSLLPEPQDVFTGPSPAPVRQAPDLPDLPRPRPITGSRLLGTLARMDRAAVATHGGAIAPLLDRLAQAHARLTGR